MNQPGAKLYEIRIHNEESSGGKISDQSRKQGRQKERTAGEAETGDSGAAAEEGGNFVHPGSYRDCADRQTEADESSEEKGIIRAEI